MLDKFNQPQAPKRNWLYTPTTSVETARYLINLDFVSKIRADLANFRVIVHHGVTGGTGYSGSTQAFQCADATETAAVYTQFVDAVMATGVVINMQP